MDIKPVEPSEVKSIAHALLKVHYNFDPEGLTMMEITNMINLLYAYKRGL